MQLFPLDYIIQPPDRCDVICFVSFVSGFLGCVSYHSILLAGRLCGWPDAILKSNTVTGGIDRADTDEVSGSSIAESEGDALCGDYEVSQAQFGQR